MTLNPAQDKFVLKRQLTPSPGFAKTTPYPPCTVTHSRPAYRRVPGSVPGAASGNAYSLNRRAVSGNSMPRICLIYINIVKLSKEMLNVPSNAFLTYVDQQNSQQDNWT